MIKQTFAEWKEEGIRRFGDDIEKWEFKCPNCGHIASVRDFLVLGAKMDDAHQECIGRRLDERIGCNWTAYGLLEMKNIRKIITLDKTVKVFDFA